MLRIMRLRLGCRQESDVGILPAWLGGGEAVSVMWASCLHGLGASRPGGVKSYRQDACITFTTLPLCRRNSISNKGLLRVGGGHRPFPALPFPTQLAAIRKMSKAAPSSYPARSESLPLFPLPPNPPHPQAGPPGKNDHGSSSAPPRRHVFFETKKSSLFIVI